MNYPQKLSSLKLMKRTGIYQGSNYNVTFDPSKIEARSYKWWSFVSVIEGVTIFNNYRYSVTTSKHQSRVSQVMDALKIKVGMTLPIPEGLQKYSTLKELILASEEHLCDQFLTEQLKKQERYARAKQRKFEKMLTTYLEDNCAFRDYEIKAKSQFGKYNKIAVHQIVEKETLENDVQNAIYNFSRDGFGSIVFYV